MTRYKATLISAVFAMIAINIWPATAVPNSAIAIDDTALAVIVNKTNPTNELTQADLEKIFLGKRSFWRGGTIIRRCDLIEPDAHEEETARAVFSVAYLHKDLMTLKSYWIKMIFSGRGQPPTSFSRPEDVINFVAKHLGGIGYISTDDITDEIKVIKITGNPD